MEMTLKQNRAVRFLRSGSSESDDNAAREQMPSVRILSWAF